jgi:hypothetical protein
MYGILLEDKPDLILELSPPGRLRYRFTREAADIQIRSRTMDVVSVYNDLLGDNCSFTGGLNAIDTMGIRLYFYRKIAMGLLSLTYSVYSYSSLP